MRRQKILIVDDDVNICELLKLYLEKNGFEFIGAYADYDFTPADDSCQRIYIAARCKKTEI